MGIIAMNTPDLDATQTNPATAGRVSAAELIANLATEQFPFTRAEALAVLFSLESTSAEIAEVIPSLTLPHDLRLAISTLRGQARLEGWMDGMAKGAEIYGGGAR